MPYCFLPQVDQSANHGHPCQAIAPLFWHYFRLFLWRRREYPDPDVTENHAQTQLHSQVLLPVLPQEETVVIRSARPSALFCTRVKNQLVADQTNWVHDVRDDHLDAQVKS